MINLEQQNILNKLIANLNPMQIAWVSGYLAGTIANNTQINDVDNAKIKTIFDNFKDLTIIYITETGNSKFLANELTKKFKEQKINIKLKAVEQYRHSDFISEKNLLLITSTHGDGEVPESGKGFFDFIKNNQLDLTNLNFAIIALGDKNYPLFCKAGKDFAEVFVAKKAVSVIDNIELDLDFENHLASIFSQIFANFQNKNSKQVNDHKAIDPEVKSTLSNQFTGKIIANTNLNDDGSTKQTHHLEILSDQEIDYQPGDSLGILFDNEDLKITGKITPRLYSIASAKSQHCNEIHLCVGLVRYKDSLGQEIFGLFSNKLASLKINDSIKFYLSKNRQFKLPKEDRDIIMVGAGTGISAFRSFLFERNATNASGKNWLFFGERNIRSDFLYQSELQDFLASKVLTKLTLAFSRDQEQKIYVQDRLQENAYEVYKWLENDSYFYVCGDKENMAKAVEQTLLNIIAKCGNKDSIQAKNYLDNLKEQGRYLLDVY